MKRFAPTFVLLACALCLGACQSSSKTQTAAATVGTPVNKVCPLMTEHPVSKTVTVMHKGQTVGFCCDDCKDSFENMSEQEKDAALAAAIATTN